MNISSDRKTTRAIFPIRSLKTRVTIFTLTIFILGLWSLEFYASRMLRKDMQHLVSEQQFSTASFIAAEINSRIDDRLLALEKVAEQIDPTVLNNPTGLQALLEQRPILPILFNGGAFFTGIDGIAAAAIPLSLNRRGVNYLDRDFIVSALKEGKATIGRPVMGKRLKSPIIGMAVPIRDGRGKVVGALAGVTNLSAPNFLDRLTEGRYAKTGGYLLVSPQHRLTVTASDKRHIMEALPAPGSSPLSERFIQGYEGSGVYVNPQGVEVLVSAKGVPLAGWYVAVSLPSAEAFAPIDAMQQRMLKATIFLTLLAGFLTLWMLKHQLSPMLVAVRTLTKMANADHPSQPLPITRQDEIGELIGGFNRLLETLAQREEALQASAGQLARTMSELNIILENAPIGIFKLVDRKPVWVNRTAEELFQYVKEELELETTRKLYPSEEAYEKLGREAYPALIEGRIFETEREMTRKDGTQVLTRLIGKAVEPPDLAKGTIWLLEDITERNRAKAKIMEIANQLAMAEEMSHSGSWSYSLATNDFWASAEACRIFGFATAGERIPRAEVEACIPERELVHQALVDLINGGKEYRLEYAINPADGSAPKIIVSIAQLERDGLGQPVKVNGVIQDITERKRLDRALLEKNVELELARAVAEKANRAKSEFLSGLSHELRSPLNAILGFAQLMNKASSQPTPRQQTSIAQILKAGWYLLKLINEILDLAMIESGRLSMVLEPVDLAEVMRECQAIIEPQAKQGDIRLSFPQFESPYFVRADCTRIKQVLINLLTNAIKYNRVQGAVVVGCSAISAEWIRISVQDTGVGLPPEKLAQLFQPFNRLGQETGPVEGTGIGLVMSKQLIELMGGEIGVESTVGVGTLFWVDLNPAAAPQRGTDPAETPAAQSALIKPGAALRNLLYIEDNRANMQLVEELIELRADLCLLGTEDGRQGIAMARRLQPEVILMDINLHGISGLQALKILREDPATAHIPVLAISAKAMPHEIKKGLEAGFCHYLTKPIKIDEFMEALDLALNLAKRSSDDEERPRA